MNRTVIALLTLVVLTTGACASKPPTGIEAEVIREAHLQFQRLAGEFVSPVHITKPVDQQSAVSGSRSRVRPGYPTPKIGCIW
jgi:hypothetical protein